MRVIWVSPYPPFPVTTGGRRRVASLLQRLAPRHQITFLAYDRGDDPAACAASRFLVPDLHLVPRRPTRSLVNAALWAVGPWPFMAVANGFNWAMIRSLRRLARRVRPHVIHCEHFHLWGVVSAAREEGWPPVVVSEQGVEFLVTERFASIPRSLPLRLGLRLELAKARRWETKVCRQATRVIAVSPHDAALLGAFVPREKIAVVENGVDVSEFSPDPRGLDPESRMMLFIGTFSFFGNRDSLRYLATEILPRVRDACPDAWVLVVGEDPPRIDDPAIRCVGTVSDVVPHVRKARMLLAPLRTGSGTKLKILEAMACGIPFVTTSVGAEGIRGAQEAGIIADDTDGLVSGAIRLLTDLELARRLGARGRQIVEDAYSWDVSASALERVWHEAVATAEAPHAPRSA